MYSALIIGCSCRRFSTEFRVRQVKLNNESWGEHSNNVFNTNLKTAIWDFESGSLSRKHALHPESAIPAKETWSEAQDELGGMYACLAAGYTTLCRQTFTRGGYRTRLKSDQSMDSHQFFANACGAMYLCRVKPTQAISVSIDRRSEIIKWNRF